MSGNNRLIYLQARYLNFTFFLNAVNYFNKNHHKVLTGKFIGISLTLIMYAPVTVVIPAYNATDFLQEALESVHDQTLSVSEIIVIDDGSTDGTYRLAKSLDARVIRQPNRGVSVARNVGIRAAKEEWVAFLDADDIWEQEKIEKQWEMINLYPDVRIVSCDHAIISENVIVESSYLNMLGEPYHSLKGRERNNYGSYFSSIEEDFFDSKWVLYPSTVITRKETFNQVGFFNHKLLMVEDYECFMRIIARYPLAVIEHPLVRYRLHEKNAHNNLPLMRSSLLKYFEMVLAKPENYPGGAERTAVKGKTWLLTTDNFYLY